MQSRREITAKQFFEQIIKEINEYIKTHAGQLKKPFNPRDTDIVNLVKEIRRYFGYREGYIPESPHITTLVHTVAYKNMFERGLYSLIQATDPSVYEAPEKFKLTITRINDILGKMATGLLGSNLRNRVAKYTQNTTLTDNITQQLEVDRNEQRARDEETQKQHATHNQHNTLVSKLPQELWSEIISHTDIQTKISLLETSLFFHASTKDNAIWAQEIRKQFPAQDLSEMQRETDNFYELYKKLSRKSYWLIPVKLNAMSAPIQFLKNLAEEISSGQLYQYEFFTQLTPEHVFDSKKAVDKYLENRSENYLILEFKLPKEMIDKELNVNNGVNLLNQPISITTLEYSSKQTFTAIYGQGASTIFTTPEDFQEKQQFMRPSWGN